MAVRLLVNSNMKNEVGDAPIGNADQKLWNSLYFL